MKIDKCLLSVSYKAELGHYLKLLIHTSNLKPFNKMQIFGLLWVLIDLSKDSKLRKGKKKSKRKLAKLSHRRPNSYYTKVELSV